MRVQARLESAWTYRGRVRAMGRERARRVPRAGARQFLLRTSLSAGALDAKAADLDEASTKRPV